LRCRRDPVDAGLQYQPRPLDRLALYRPLLELLELDGRFCPCDSTAERLELLLMLLRTALLDDLPDETAVFRELLPVYPRACGTLACDTRDGAA